LDKHVWQLFLSENTMKKIFSIGLLTVCALAICEREAHAWSNTKFSIGLNYHRQSASNNFLWGFYKNGQVPGPEAFGGGGAPFPGGPYMPPPAGSFPFLGNGQNAYPPVQTTPPPQAAQQQAYYGNYYYNPYQTVSYQPSGYYYPVNYYPTYGNYYYGSYGYQAPSYWYQGR
jgi:hypothetical protein